MVCTYQDLAKQINAEFRNSKSKKNNPDLTVTPISIDSRTIKQKQWFAAIKGPNFDGHDFIKEAIKNNASGLIVNKFQEKYPDIPQIIYPDTTKALGLIAKKWREQFDIPVIGITGSSGKTSTKDMLANILKQRFNILATDGNKNNEYGVPLTIMRLTPEHQIAIIEMGINSPNEMEYLTNISQPTIGLITNISEAHVGNFDSLDSLAKEKWKIFNSPKIKMAILNIDDEFISKQNLDNITILKYSKSQKTDIYASDISWGHSVAGNIMQFRLHTPINDEIIALPLIGEHWITNAAAAATCALSVGAYPEDIRSGLKDISPIKGRMYPYYLPDGNILIDDTYNASIDSVIQAIHTLTNMPDKRLLILSTLAETGDFSESLHKKIGKALKKAGFDHVIITGDESAINFIKSEFNKFEVINNKSELSEKLKDSLSDYKSILIKGSRKYKLEEIIDSALNKSKTMFVTN